MNIVYLFLALCISTSSCAPILLHKTLETPFMQMNEPCYVFSENVFICDDINKAIKYDSDINDDIKKVCKRSKIYNFTNDDLSDLINSKFTKYGGPCEVKTINNLGSIQLRKQCPDIYTGKC